MKNKHTARPAFLKPRLLLDLLLCAVAVDSLLSGTLLGFVHSEAAEQSFQRTLTFAQRVGYQRAMTAPGDGLGAHDGCRPLRSQVDELLDYIKKNSESF